MFFTVSSLCVCIQGSFLTAPAHRASHIDNLSDNRSQPGVGIRAPAPRKPGTTQGRSGQESISDSAKTL